MAVPQGVAYAMIAGLPPAMGLYAAAVPTVLAALARSSSHVVTGPTNALSLLVGLTLANEASDGDPILFAATLALLVGAFQFAAGALRLGSIVDYISKAVVLGYITGAGLLIGFGQLGYLTQTSMGRGDPATRFMTWVSGLHGANPLSVGLGLGTLAVLLLQRRYLPRAPGAILVLIGGIVLSWLFDLEGMGLATAGQIAPVPAGLPPLTRPPVDAATLQLLLPAAVAATVLSLVESSAVARSIAAESGERLDMNREFLGQGLSNLGAAFTGGYPVSGSLSRSALNFRAGAVSRLSGVFSGLLMVLVLLLAGPFVDLTPIASLAGLLLLVARDLVDEKAIKQVMHAIWGDRLAFLATVVGTWTLPLDLAIYLGVGISILLFLRRVRHLRVTDLVVSDNHIREATGDFDAPLEVCRKVRALHVEGNLFFGAASELQDALDDATRDPSVRVLIVRLKRARGLDYTTAGVLLAMRARLAEHGRHLLLAGMKPGTMALFDDVGLTEQFGDHALFPTQTEWFLAMNEALVHGLELGGGACATCPLAHYLRSAGQEVPEGTCTQCYKGVATR
ncbi:MAG: SulP family inorganic anion transporter [Alphaproteobacteria bacterium]|nr:SulP family inorganic anion transporter [Alphaproteobacteria bacterium]